MRQSIRRPSAAMVVACLALLVALGGTSYATVLQVPRNSVGPLQLKRNAVGPSKIAPNAIRTSHVLNASLLSEDFKAGQIPQGPKGDKGDKGNKGDPGTSAYQIVSIDRTTTSQFLVSESVGCPSGKRAVGGGARSSINGINGPWLASSSPTVDGSGWTANFGRSTQIPASWTITVYALCAVVTT